MSIVGPRGIIALSWDWRLVGLSAVLAIAGCCAGLECLERARVAEDTDARREALLLGAGLTGLAIWASHFVGIMALQMPVVTSHALGWMAVSVVAAIGGTAVAFWLATQRGARAVDLALGGIAMGVAIAVMHYLAVKSLRLPLKIEYVPARFGASVLMAIGASTAAMWLSLCCARAKVLERLVRLGVGAALGFAIVAMHYVAMSAARYSWHETAPTETVAASVGAMPLRDLVEMGAVIVALAVMALAIRVAVERQRAVRAYEKLAAELETRVHERTAELQRSNDDLVAFTDSVSHDLRGPLRTIAGFADALLDVHAGPLDETGKHYLRRIKAGADRLDDLLMGLLKLSRISRVQVQREPVDLTALARTILADQAAQEPARRVEVFVAEGLVAEGDRALIISLLQNLLDNAWKFTRDRADARIEFGSEVRDGRAMLVVRDNGAGFDSANAPRLFGMFERMHVASQFPGNGIGLALSKRIIERHGGVIWAESRPGEGAAFYFTLGGF